MQNSALTRDIVPPGFPIPPVGMGSYLSIDMLRSHPRLKPLILKLSTTLLERYFLSPRLCRSLGSQQRWLMSMGALALFLEQNPSDPESGLSVGRLRDLITTNNAASRNTVLNFVEEMRHYRLILEVPQQNSSRGRRKLLTFADSAIEAMHDWFRANLAALDFVDDGNRLQKYAENPGLLRRALAVAARSCIEDPNWNVPPGDLGIFQWTDGGGLVMDEIVVRAGMKAADAEGRIHIGALKLRKLAEDFMMSHTHLQRVFRKATELGVVGWNGSRRKAELWVKEDFLKQYREWQAIKLSHLDRAFRLAEAEAARAQRASYYG